VADNENRLIRLDQKILKPLRGVDVEVIRRFVEQQQIGLSQEQLGQLRFNATATLYTGERDTDDIKGISTPASDYEMHVAQEGSRWVFDFRDKNGRSGTLTLPMPDTRSIRASIRVRVGQVPRCTRNG
jgi:hypothetical protein